MKNSKEVAPQESEGRNPSDRWWNKPYSSQFWTRAAEEDALRPQAFRLGSRNAMRCLTVYAVIGGFYALLAPSDIQSQSSSLAILTQWVSQTLAPGIPKFGRISTLPEITMTYLALMTALAPLAMAAMWMCIPIKAHARFVWQRNAAWRTRIYLYLIAPILLAGIVILALISPYDFHSDSIGRHNTMLMLMSETRLGLALVGGFLCSGTLGGAFAALLLISTPLIAVFYNADQQHEGDKT